MMHAQMRFAAFHYNLFVAKWTQKSIADPLHCFNYLLKYVTKQEVASNFLQKLTEAVSKSSNKSVLSKVANLVYQIMGQRDISG